MHMPYILFQCTCLFTFYSDFRHYNIAINMYFIIMLNAYIDLNNIDTIKNRKTNILYELRVKVYFSKNVFQRVTCSVEYLHF